MSEEKKPLLSQNIILAIIIFFSVGSLFAIIEYSTIDQAKVPVPCDIIWDNSIPTPDNVITKGYDVLRNDTSGETINQKDDSISYNCYYVKDAGIIERTYRDWKVMPL